MPFNDKFFDVVTAVSTIEHIGLGCYGDSIAPDGDKEATTEIKRVLKRGGAATTNRSLWEGHHLLLERRCAFKQGILQPIAGRAIAGV